MRAIYQKTAIIAAFGRHGVLNEKPGNDDPFKSRLDRPPSQEITARINPCSRMRKVT